MIDQLYIYESDSLDPYQNLATEKCLLDRIRPGECCLYLWQNENTVVIGRNQNPWVECRTSLLEEEGGRLARRLSGGGAVFHDIGNLNFTFLLNREDYDLDRQLRVIQSACSLVGISAERSGRNDLLAQGRKFSGNAFYQDKLHAYHHGTLMLQVDNQKLGRYLSPSKAKLAAKGVASVRSRVINLTELVPSLTCRDMKQGMIDAFCQVYGFLSQPLALTPAELAAIDSLAREYGSWEYLYGTPLPFTFECDDRFLWGGLRIELQAKNGLIQGARVYSDAMDWELPGRIETALTGCRFQIGAMLRALEDASLPPEVLPDLQTLLAKQQL